ncbi:uncharacterized protein LOC112637992 [Camponotus floridanus]|uniref:uncharacterized protein LOC112637992 n=1 Tax=Camponotus floridanus TaxID=104421 RepID=UPI000DC6C7A6|nr:uncharacterized protein LOC112637992 [Camponotus floridanus]
MAVLLKTVPRLPIVLRTFLNPCNHLVMGAVLGSRVFKDGDRSLVSNYRSISKQNPMPKIFENIVAGKLSALSKNALIDEQHGFVAGRSTVTNLLIYHDFIISAVEESSQIDAVYTNFWKAFDNVDHVVLLRKLQAFGIGGLWLKWLSDFVTDRLQMT